MPDAVIVSTARTALAKSWRGAFNMTHGATLAGHVVRHAIDRAELDPAEVDDVLIGCAFPEGATGHNIARQIAIRAGCPVSVPGATINRFCSSGLQTIAIASQRIIAGEADAFVAGGIESISCVQNEMNKHMLREAWLVEHKPAIYWPMLQTAENVARRYDITRDLFKRQETRDFKPGEDWSVLRQGGTGDVFDRLKYIPLSDDGRYWAGFGAQLLYLLRSGFRLEQGVVDPARNGAAFRQGRWRGRQLLWQLPSISPGFF